MNIGLFCDAHTGLASTIDQVPVAAINSTHGRKDTFLTTLIDNVSNDLTRENDQALAGIDKRLEELHTQLKKATHRPH